MTEDNRFSKVQILIQQEKFDEAKKILSDLLSGEPNNIQLLLLMGEVLLQQDKFYEAHRIIDNAIGITPDEPQLFYMKSRIAMQEDEFHEAESYIYQAIELDPYDADYFALLANIKLTRKKYDEALEMANKALEIDAENLFALNTRSAALIKLNRSDESFQTIEGALREDPNDAYTHANYGWGLLESGDHKKALTHFKEALTNDPSSEYAQAGILRAIQATNPIYRLFLKYAFWMGNLTAKYQWGVIIGVYLAIRGLGKLASTNEALQPYLTPVIITLVLIIFSTWIISPISNLFLRFNKYGQLLLDKKEKMSSSFVALSFVVSLIGILLYFLLPDERMLAIAIYGFAMMLPLGTMFSPSKNKYVLLIYTITLAVIGSLAVLLTFTTGDMFNSMTFPFVLGFVGFQLLANFMLIKEDNR